MQTDRRLSVIQRRFLMLLACYESARWDVAANHLIRNQTSQDNVLENKQQQLLFRVSGARMAEKHFT